jgi:hypothetical protein
MALDTVNKVVNALPGSETNKLHGLRCSDKNVE